MSQPAESHGDLVQIGVLAESVGLSLRTVRYYEEVGLVEPAARTSGGFRLYTPEQEERLRILKTMKPLGFSLDEMRGFIQLIADASHARSGSRRALVLLQQINTARHDILERRAVLMDQVEATKLISRTLDRAARDLT